jgi:Mpv17 / PMP22 family
MRMRITTSSGRLTNLCTCLAGLASLVIAITHAAWIDTETSTLLVVEQLACPLGSTLALNVTVGQLSYSPYCGGLANESIVCLSCNDDDERIHSTAAAKAFHQVATWYRESLEVNPVLTKSTTAAFIGACGDVMAQIIEARTGGLSFRWSGLHLRRMLAIAAEGLCISGPLMHLSYEALEKHFPVFAEDGSSSADSWFMVILQVLVDAIIMDSVFVATVIVAGTVLEGRGGGIWEKLRSSYIPAVRASWKSSLFWSPVQLLSFKYVPLHFRVVAVNLQDIAWSATISCMAHRCPRAYPDTGIQPGNVTCADQTGTCTQ